MQSQPGVGTASTFTRKLWIALTGNDNSSYPSAAELVNPGCEVSFGFVSDLASPAAGISVTTSTSLADFTTLAIEPNCTFNHLFALAWDTFRSSAYANCGFTVTSNTTNPVNGTYKNFHGRVHIKWEDWNATTGGTLVRPAANTWLVSLLVLG